MITILGASGFIGSHIVKLLQKDRAEFYAPARNEDLNTNNLGDIIYCIGLTADFRSKPFETVEAHVCKLLDILKNNVFNSLTYLSSARVYINCKEKEVNENSIIPVNPHEPEDLYTLTKLTGERICLSSGKKVKIARISNVYGNDNTSENFLTDVIKRILLEQAVSFNVLPSSAKDYISVNDVASLLIKIAAFGKSLMYNIASGLNTSNAEIITELKKQLHFDVSVQAGSKAVVFPLINIDKIKQEFSYTPGNITTFIPHLINNYYNVSD